MQAPLIARPFVVVPSIAEMVCPEPHGEDGERRHNWQLPLAHACKIAAPFAEKIFVATSLFEHAERLSNQFVMPARLITAQKLDLLNFPCDAYHQYMLTLQAIATVEKLPKGEIAVFVAFPTAITALVEPLVPPVSTKARLANAAYLVVPGKKGQKGEISEIMTPAGRPVRSPALDRLVKALG